jgi:NTP pyrophosphatase (non-canonical NTP hydrolase)
MDALRDLAASTLAFYKRFGAKPEIESSIRNLREEVYELIEAAQSGDDKAHIGEEAADVLVTTLGVCFAAGLDIEQIIKQVYVVIQKNNAKTEETHELANGKIRRRVE